jgi:23S rRNA (uracil1939-C5)-methyltransferase
MTKQTSQQTAFAIDDNGKGIIRVDDKTIFIANLLPEETAEISTTYKYGKLKYATLDKRLTTSKDRVTPKCVYYDACGGCNLMHLSYAKQLEYKQQKVKNLLHKFARVDVDVNPTIGMENPYNFRNKIQVPVRLNNEGEIITGFFKENSHDIIDIDGCLIEDNRARPLLNAVKESMRIFNILPFDEFDFFGIVRHIVIKTSLHFDEIMLVLVTTQLDFENKKGFIENILKECPQITTIIQNVNSERTNVILGKKEIVIYGPGYIQDSILDMKFLISSLSFYQTNPIQTEKLYSVALKEAKLKSSNVVLDAYSGIGTIGICASTKVQNVTCVEIISSAITDSKNNAKLNNIKNINFIKADCTDFIINNDVHFDVVFLDPPRKGSTPEFLNALKEIGPAKIIYISCNPVTLSRDLTFLLDKYEISSITPVDMFPQSAHVETVISLSLKHE